MKVADATLALDEPRAFGILRYIAYLLDFEEALTDMCDALLQ